MNSSDLDEKGQAVVDKNSDWSPFIDYLRSPEGHQIASRVVGLIEEIKKATLDKGAIQFQLDHKQKINLYFLQGAVFAIAIISASTLTYYDKFNSPMALLFGTMVGYFFGRRGDSN